MPVSTDVAVDARQVRKSYQGRPVVDGVDLVARAGQVTAVLGPNGAGKTTTIECCEGLRRPDSGQIRVLGLDPTRDRAELRRRVGVMLQDGGLPTGAKAREVLSHISAMHDSPRPTAELVERLGLDACAETSVRRLSGGERQRLALAAAVVGRPDVVFLDEPSAGLDPHARLAVWDLVRELREDGVTVVLTTHAMVEAERLADQVHIIDAGRVIASGSPAELVAGHGTVLDMRLASPIDTGELARALNPASLGLEAIDVVAVHDDPCRYLVTARSGSATPGLLAAVASGLAAQHVLALSLSSGARSLEDVFLELTGRALR